MKSPFDMNERACSLLISFRYSFSWFNSDYLFLFYLIYLFFFVLVFVLHMQAAFVVVNVLVAFRNYSCYLLLSLNWIAYVTRNLKIFYLYELACKHFFFLVIILNNGHELNKFHFDLICHRNFYNYFIIQCIDTFWCTLFLWWQSAMRFGCASIYWIRWLICCCCFFNISHAKKYWHQNWMFQIRTFRISEQFSITIISFDVPSQNNSMRNIAIFVALAKRNERKKSMA